MPPSSPSSPKSPAIRVTVVASSAPIYCYLLPLARRLPVSRSDKGLLYHLLPKIWSNFASHDRERDPWRLPPSLDPEWIAFEVYTEAEDSDSDSEFEEASETLDSSPPANIPLSESMSQLKINESPTTSRSQKSELNAKQPPPWVNAIRTSLSLLELLRLTSLQQFQQQSHLSINDELLNFFLEESATTVGGGDEGRRQALRADARRRVGWDPYDESPIKRRGEDYQYANSSRIDGGTPNQVNGGWSSPDARSTPATGRIQTLSPSPSPGLPTKSRPGWLKGQDERKPSPLGAHRVSDEGIGTSPGSGQDQASPISAAASGNPIYAEFKE